MSLTIDREQRDAIHGELVRQLTGVGDVYIAIARDDYADACQLRDRFEAAMRLLDDLGWEPDTARQSFELTAPAGQLVCALRWLFADAVAQSRLDATDPQDEEGLVERVVIVCDVCGRLLAQIAERQTSDNVAADAEGAR